MTKKELERKLEDLRENLSRLLAILTSETNLESAKARLSDLHSTLWGF